MCKVNLVSYSFNISKLLNFQVFFIKLSFITKLNLKVLVKLSFLSSLVNANYNFLANTSLLKGF